MIPEENNLRVRIAERHLESRHDDHHEYEETADSQPLAPARTNKKSIDVVFDLTDPEQANKLEGHRAAFGEAYAEVNSLGEGKVVLKIYPGEAKGLR
jgi:hypothetical protein